MLGFFTVFEMNSNSHQWFTGELINFSDIREIQKIVNKKLYLIGV